VWAYGELATWAGGPQSLAGIVTLEPGVYDVWAVALNGTVTLSGAGVYIFRSASSLPVSVGAKVILTNGADACNVFWRMVAGMTIGAWAEMVGTIISDTAITLWAGATLQGRAFSQSAQVTLINNQITKPTCNPTLRVFKTVINNNWGSALFSSFNLHVKFGWVEVAGSPALAIVAGTLYTLAAGTYVVSEDTNASYTASFGWSCDAVGSVTLLPDDVKTCTITNDDIAAPSGGGGGWSLSVDICPNWDYSSSYYDRTCWVAPSTWTIVHTSTIVHTHTWIVYVSTSTPSIVSGVVTSVFTPWLPKTGIYSEPHLSWNIVVLASIFMIFSLSFVVALKKTM